MLIPTGTDILTLPSGFYYVSGTNAVDIPMKRPMLFGLM
ncbi:hypothetical protein BSAF29S_06738 [Bacillus safensis subsp. safensis]